MNNDITIIIPLHETNDTVCSFLDKAIESVRNCQQYYKDGKPIVTVVAPFEQCKPSVDEWIVNNSGNTTYCGQINYAVEHIDTKYFSILEYDDTYFEKWFKFFSQYLYGNEDVSVFLPLNVISDINGEHWQYGNEMPLASYFSANLGFVDFDCLQDWSNFTLAGAVINRDDFINVGKYKPSIKLVFDYELLLRLTNRQLKVMVVPKEGYKHIVGREGSLTDIYRKEMEGTNAMQKWFDLAKREYQYTEDRKKGISSKEKAEELK